jgi:predicted transposase/invertase (TIGR01784 family)
VYYLKNSKILDTFTARGLKEAREQLLFDNLSQEEKGNYIHHVEQTVFEKTAIDDAKEEKALTIAHKLLQKGMSIDEVCDITGLSEHQIKYLI